MPAHLLYSAAMQLVLLQEAGCGHVEDAHFAIGKATGHVRLAWVAGQARHGLPWHIKLIPAHACKYLAL